MKNAKHAIVGIITIAMIGSLSVKQAYDFKASNRLAALLNKNVEVSDVITQEEIRINPEDAAQQLLSTYTKEELESISNKKSTLQDSYVLLTYGTLNVYSAPSDDSTITDTLAQCTNVRVTESTEGWYKIAYGQGQTGYVSKVYITDSKSEAEYAAMHYDNYKQAKVKTNGGDVNIRRGASSNASIIGQLENGSDLVLLYDENGYTKVYFGTDMEAGFIVSSAIELTNTWIPKTQVSEIQTAAAQRKAAEARARAEAAEKAKAAAKAKSSSTASSKSYSTPATSSKGQAMVEQAKKYLGVRYVYGGTTPSGFDCSGLVQYVCKSLGIRVNRTAAAQFSNGKAVNKSDLQPGDLLFFAKNGRINHVGIYAGNGQMIHAPQTGDVVRYSSINTAYRKNGYVGARRLY